MSIPKVLAKTGKTIRVIALTFSFGYITFNFIAEPIICSGPSMEPTIRDKDIILIERYSSVFTKRYNRGDIVVSRCPTAPNTFICKRVMAIAGDTVRQGFLSQQVIPRGHVWLTGDHINQSTDSREFGPIPIGLILGRVVLRACVVAYRLMPKESSERVESSSYLEVDSQEVCSQMDTKIEIFGRK